MAVIPVQSEGPEAPSVFACSTASYIVAVGKVTVKVQFYWVFWFQARVVHSASAGDILLWGPHHEEL